MECERLRHSNERSPSALERGKFVCKSLSLPVPITIVEVHERTKYAIWAFADYSWLEASVKTNDVDNAAAQEAWRQKTVTHEKALPKVKREVNDEFVDLPWKEGLTHTVKALESRLTSSQTEVEELEEKLLASSKRLEKSTSTAPNAEQVASILRIELQASEGNSEKVIDYPAFCEDHFACLWNYGERKDSLDWGCQGEATRHVG